MLLVPGISKEMDELIKRMTEGHKETPIGNAVRNLRIMYGEYLCDQADRLGMSPAGISGIQWGRDEPPEGFEEKLKQAYGIDKLPTEKHARPASDFNCADILSRPPRLRLCGPDQGCLFYARRRLPELDRFRDQRGAKIYRGSRLQLYV